jgi:hypothetical protein
VPRPRLFFTEFLKHSLVHIPFEFTTGHRGLYHWDLLTALKRSHLHSNSSFFTEVRNNRTGKSTVLPLRGMMQTRQKAQRLLPGYMAAWVAEVTDHGKGFFHK